MAALDFPSSPTNGQTTSQNGKTWIWDSTSTSWKSNAPTGYSGSIGPQGPQGAQGPQGYTGSAGPSTSVNATDDTATTALYPVMVAAAGSTQTAKVTTTKLYFNASTGELSATSYNAISDQRAKTNIRDLGYGLDTVLRLNGKKFELIDGGVTAIGLIAQEVEEVVPEVVFHGHVHKGLNYGALVSVLIEAVKELNQKIERLSRDA